MKALMDKRLMGLKKQFCLFKDELEGYEVSFGNISSFAKILSDQMRRLNYDNVKIDKAGNVVGLIRGYSNKRPIVVISHMDHNSSSLDSRIEFKENDAISFKSGILSSIYSGGLLKSALLPLEGDLYICSVPRLDLCNYGIKYLFDNTLKNISKIARVILSEPTGLNINVGHKGRFEYEIVVKGEIGSSILQDRGVNMLGTMFPLINELEKASRDLPHNSLLGNSSLNIKDVGINRIQSGANRKEFKIIVDRGFVPEETTSAILKRAKSIARGVYGSKDGLKISAVATKEKIKSYTGKVFMAKKEFKPWSIAVDDNFVLKSLNSLKELNPKATVGYWRKIITDGSYTFADLGIPTIGFGAGFEDDIKNATVKISETEILNAVKSTAVIIHRNIGLPSFGWSSDDI